MKDDALRQRLAEAEAALQAAAAALETERNRFRALFDAVPDPVSIIDWEGTVLDLNKAGMAAYKRPREDIVGRGIETLNPDLPRDHLAPVWEVLNRGGTYVVEVTNMRADGTRFPVEVHSAGFDDEGQRRIVAVARDLSRRHEAEVRYRELMEVIDKGILVRKADGRVAYANPAAMRILQIPKGASLVEELALDHWRIFDEHGKQLDDQELPSFRALRTGTISPSTVLGFLNLATRRLIWLSINLGTAFLAASVVGEFADTIDKLVALAVLMPIVAGMGGNAGTQVLALMVRGLALGQVGAANVRTLLWKEARVALLNGLVLGTGLALIVLAWFHSIGLSIVIATALTANLLFAAVAGVLVPVTIKRFGYDPALASGIFLTTVTDVMGFFTFLGLATVMLLR